MVFSISNLFFIENEFLKYNLKQVFEEPVFAITIIVIVAVSSHIYYFLCNFFETLYGYVSLKQSKTTDETLELKQSQKTVFHMENLKK